MTTNGKQIIQLYAGYFGRAPDPADASDTLAVDAKLLGIRLFFTVNNLSDG